MVSVGIVEKMLQNNHLSDPFIHLQDAGLPSSNLCAQEKYQCLCLMQTN